MRTYPTNNALSDAENLVTKHRLSIQIGAKCAKNVYMPCGTVCITTGVPFCVPPLVVGSSSKEGGGVEQGKERRGSCVDDLLLSSLLFFLKKEKRGFQRWLKRGGEF